MNGNNGQKEGRLLSPIYFVNAAFAIYFIPLVLVIFMGESLVKNINPRDLSYPSLVLIIHILLFFILNLICLIATSKAVRFAPFPVFSLATKIFFLVIYALISFGSIFYLESALQLGDLIRSLFFDPLVYLVSQRDVGVMLMEGGILKFYFLAHLSFVTIYICMKLANGRSFLISFILGVVYIGLLIFFYFLSRREAVIFGCLILFFSYRKIFNSFKLGLLILMLMLFFVVTINIRDGSNSIFDIINFISGQEFYPFQAGAVLVDKWISSPTYNNLFEITPAMYFVPEFETLSSRSMYEEFGLKGPGPTVGIVYAILKYAILAPLAVFSIATFIGAAIYKNARVEKSGWPWIPLHAFYSLKLFLLIRNGEFANFLIDISIFLILYIPILIVFQGGYKKVFHD